MLTGTEWSGMCVFRTPVLKFVIDKDTSTVTEFYQYGSITGAIWTPEPDMVETLADLSEDDFATFTEIGAELVESLEFSDAGVTSVEEVGRCIVAAPDSYKSLVPLGTYYVQYYDLALVFKVSYESSEDTYAVVKFADVQREDGEVTYDDYQSGYIAYHEAAFNDAVETSGILKYAVDSDF